MNKKIIYALSTLAVATLTYIIQSPETTRHDKETIKYLYQRITTPDNKKGYNKPGIMLEISAIREDPESQYQLGAFYLEKVSGNPYDPEKGQKWMLQAARQNYSPAQLWLGNMYHFGYGVTKDTRQSVKWYLKAARNGQPVAQSNLGVLYMTGDGVPQDVQQAVAWFR